LQRNFIQSSSACQGEKTHFNLLLQKALNGFHGVGGVGAQPEEQSMRVL
jgi:hypothetical protein